MKEFGKMFDFSDKVAVIVGASLGGIGTSIASALKACNANVTITGLEREPVASVAGIFTYFQLDVCDIVQVKEFASRFEKADILINCAGISGRGENKTVELFKRIVDINLFGTYSMCKAFEEPLSQNCGCIINIGSMYGHLGNAQVPGYGAAKAGIHQLTRSLAIAFAPKGIRVNAIAPGFINTPGTEVGRSDQSHYNSVLKRTPMNRWGEANEIAGPALFLASGGSSFVTGIVLNVDGGYLAG